MTARAVSSASLDIAGASAASAKAKSDHVRTSYGSSVGGVQSRGEMAPPTPVAADAPAAPTQNAAATLSVDTGTDVSARISREDDGNKCGASVTEERTVAVAPLSDGADMGRQCDQLGSNG